MAQSMIKLTFGLDQAVKVFDQESIILGAGSADIEGLPLDSSALRPEHVKIFEKDGLFFAQNLANDPFVTLNGRPFGKKRLTPGDRLTLGGTEIIIEGQSSATKLDRLSDTLDHVMQKPTDDDLNIDDLIREIENFPEASRNPEPELPPQSQPSFKAHPLQDALTDMQARVGRETIARQGTVRHWTPRSLRDRPVGRSRRDAFEDEIDPIEGSSRRARYWRPFLAVMIVIVAILAAVGSGIYFTFNEQNDEREFIAAQGLADMSMAIIYAQMHQIKPPNQNWGDPDFLKDILTRVLPTDYPSLVQLDKQGTFENCPYMLRVYTSSDLSQFLLIAQPEPNLLQWLISRETILLDSRTMELHKTNDLRALNRLLADPRPLEGANALEISHLVGQTDSIRLTTLATETGHSEYIPPKGLNKLRPGAETHVYNAPRYYLFSTPLTASIAQQTVQPNEETELELQKNALMLTKMPQFVFYSTQDDATSHRILNTLSSWVPPEAAIVAQLKLETSGRILYSRVLENEPMQTQNQVHDPSPAVQAELGEELVSIVEQSPPAASSTIAGTHRALQDALQTAAQRRREALAPYKNHLIQLLQEHVTRHNPTFAVQIDRIIRDFEDIELGQQVNIRQAIVDSYRIYVLESEELSHEQFVAEVQAAHLDNFLPQEFTQPNEDENVVAEEHPSIVAEYNNNFAERLEEVQQAQDLQELEQALTDANKELADDSYVNDSRLPTLRNKLQIQILHRLDDLLLGPSSPLTIQYFNHHNRARLQKILLAAGVDDPEQRDYYLAEFDNLLEQRHSSSEED